MQIFMQERQSSRLLEDFSRLLRFTEILLLSEIATVRFVNRQCRVNQNQSICNKCPKHSWTFPRYGFARKRFNDSRFLLRPVVFTAHRKSTTSERTCHLEESSSTSSRSEVTRATKIRRDGWSSDVSLIQQRPRFVSSKEQTAQHVDWSAPLSTNLSSLNKSFQLCVIMTTRENLAFASRRYANYIHTKTASINKVLRHACLPTVRVHVLFRLA